MSLATKKKNAYKPKSFQTYFKDYWVTKIDKEIYNEDIYNFDQTRFRNGVRKDQ